MILRRKNVEKEIPKMLEKNAGLNRRLPFWIAPLRPGGSGKVQVNVSESGQKKPLSSQKVKRKNLLHEKM